MIVEFLIKKRAKKYGVPLLKITKETLEQYKEICDAEEKDDKFLLQRKINRSWYLGNTRVVIGNIVVRHYGNMDIYCDYQTLEICNIVNHKGKNRKEYINFQDKKLINEIYCIPEKKR